MSRHFSLYIFLLFLTQNSSENTRNTLSAFDQELMNINQDLKFVNDPCGLLLRWLALARLKHKDELKENQKELNQKDKEIDNLKREKNDLQTDLSKVRSPLIARSYIDDYEDTMDSEFTFPNKQEMLKQINDPNKRDKFLITIPYDTDPNKKNKSPGTFNSSKPYTNIHEIKWFYYLLFCESGFAQKIRNLLMKNKIPVLNFCNMVGKVHEKTSGKIHGISKAISPEELKNGLKLNGILDDGFESCLDVLLALKKEEALFKGTLTTFGPSDE